MACKCKGTSKECATKFNEEQVIDPNKWRTCASKHPSKPASKNCSKAKADCEDNVDCYNAWLLLWGDCEKTNFEPEHRGNCDYMCDLYWHALKSVATGRSLIDCSCRKQDDKCQEFLEVLDTICRPYAH